jgi:hypothetical protein
MAREIFGTAENLKNHQNVIKKDVRSKIKKSRWAARKNLIQMSSDVINYNSNCHSGPTKTKQKQAWHNSRINASNY